MASPPCAIVIGAGITGLACALKLQEKLRSIQVLLVAREWPGFVPGAPSPPSVDYASMWAGAHLQREARWLRQAVAEFGRQVEAEPWCGVTRTVGIEYLEAPDHSYRHQDAASFERETGLPGYRTLVPSELPQGVELGFEYKTFCINSPLYCQHLLRKFVLQGGQTALRSLGSELEAFTLRDDVLLVVNASGTGFGDPKCFPTRGPHPSSASAATAMLTRAGQTVMTNMTDVSKTVTRQKKDGSWVFLIPRFFGGGTIMGGTKEPGDWRTEPDASTRQRILAAGLENEPYARHGASRSVTTVPRKDVQVIADIVGRRPTREGGMRVEEHEQTRGRKTRRVIHAYGAGGRGYELSWGVASEVAQLAAPLLDSKASVE